MAEDSGEQDRSEQATPFKLDKARQRGVLARGTDLGFFTVLLALAIIVQIAGTDIIAAVSGMMRRTFATIGHDNSPDGLRDLVRTMGVAVAIALIIPAFILAAMVATVEIVQNRGLIFSAKPLKPDFSRLNPAKGLKRLFSFRMLKELAKSLVKGAIYTSVAYFLITGIADAPATGLIDARRLTERLVHFSGRLLMAFIMVAAAVAILDQLLARREFARQMRMSRRDVTRENREREGEPRQKRKRRELMAELLKQSSSAGNVKGADLLIVNPVHFAVALRYRQDKDAAPVVVATGRNAWARAMKLSARRWSVPIIHQPGLARALYRTGKVGKQISPEHYVAVADLYIMMRKSSEAQMGAIQAQNV